MKGFRSFVAALLAVILLAGMLPVSGAATAEPEGEYMSMEEAAQQIKQYMLTRNPEPILLNVYIEDERTLTDEQLSELFQERVYQHTGIPTEGDYLRYSGYEITLYAQEHTRIGNEHWLTIHVDFFYHETAEEERIITEKVREIIDSLDLEGKSDRDKIWAIYCYICKNVKYDDSQAGVDIWGILDSNSAYAAIVDQKATCGGYAIALYRLLLEAGIDNRMECVAGSFKSETGEIVDGHAWNKVKLGDLYYYLDATWDAGVDPADFQWFLSGSADFLCDYHYSSAEHTTKEFMQQYPMAPITYGEPAATTGAGLCGDDATWTLTEDGTLTISGTGAIRSTVQGASQWTDVNMYVKNVVIQEGITTIGSYAFWNCPQLESVIIPSSVTRIGSYAFEGCTRLKELMIPDSVTVIGEAAFSICTALESIRLPNGLTEIKDYTFNYCNGLKSLEIPASVTAIGESAFANAFDPDANVMLVVPETVTEIANLALAWSNVATVIWNAKIEEPADGIFYGCQNLESVQLTDFIKRIGSRSFTDCGNLKTVKMPANLVEVVDEEWIFFTSGLFMYCYELESIAIPKGLTKIPQRTFDGCASLTEINLHDGITDIGPLAFRGTGISEVVIPASVERIGFDAFGCTELERVIFEGDAPTAYSIENESDIGLFSCCDVDCIFPDGNDTWTTEAMQALEGIDAVVRWRNNSLVIEEDSAAQQPDNFLPNEEGRWMYPGILVVAGTLTASVVAVILIKKKKAKKNASQERGITNETI